MGDCGGERRGHRGGSGEHPALIGAVERPLRLVGSPSADSAGTGGAPGTSVLALAFASPWYGRATGPFTERASATGASPGMCFTELQTLHATAIGRGADQR